MATLNGRTLILSSGRQMKLSGSLFISSELEIGEAFAPNLFRKNLEYDRNRGLSPVSNPYAFTRDEIDEIADFHISLWMKLKVNVRNQGITDPSIFQPD